MISDELRVIDHDDIDDICNMLNKFKYIIKRAQAQSNTSHVWYMLYIYDYID